MRPGLQILIASPTSTWVARGRPKMQGKENAEIAGDRSIPDSAPPFQVSVCARRRPQLNTLRVNTQTGGPPVPWAALCPVRSQHATEVAVTMTVDVTGDDPQDPPYPPKPPRPDPPPPQPLSRPRPATLRAGNRSICNRCHLGNLGVSRLIAEERLERAITDESPVSARKFHARAGTIYFSFCNRKAVECEAARTSAKTTWIACARSWRRLLRCIMSMLCQAYLPSLP
jgi:hypothetical protein